MVSDGTTPCSAGVRSFKEKKNLREFCQYLRTNRIDRTRILRRVGDVLVIDTEALELVKEEEEAGQRSQKGSVMDTAVVELHIRPGLNVVGTAMLDARSKERTGVTPETIAQSCVHWRGR